jgi:DNA repair protein RadA/Sms
VSKQKINYLCTSCNYTTPKWIGCCPGCSEWNSFTEQSPLVAKRPGTIEKGTSAKLFSLSGIKQEEQARMQSSIAEWDRVLGGGILPGSFLILTGDPGIGKSTLLLQVANSLAQNYDVLYFSSEESLSQVQNRAQRLNCTNEKLLFSDQASLESILASAQEVKPHLIIIDSIQNCYLSQTQAIPGTIAQVRESGFHLMRLAKENNIAVLITGHITKDGQMAGPKLLEHMVDGVFYLQGDNSWQSRILRSVKNRFGAVNEIGFFEMNTEGLVEIGDINRHLLSSTTHAPGAALVSTLEGTRPLLIELQALCITAHYGIAQRVVSGIDQKQVILIAAILEKYLKIKFSSQDIFFKVSGGLKIKENSSDLGIALALLSSYFQKPLAEKSLCCAEISLTGHIKPSMNTNSMVREAEKFGIQTIFISSNQNVEVKSAKKVELRNVYDLLNLFPED